MPHPTSPSASFPSVSYDAWSAAVEAELKGRHASSLDAQLLEGVRVKPLEMACPNGFASGAERAAISVVVAPRHGHPEPERVRAAVQDDALGGATGLFFQFGRACRFGLDGDHPAALEHLVEGGTAIGQTRDLATAIELGASRLRLFSFDGGANAVPLLALTEATLASLGVDRAQLMVHAGFDPVGALLRDGAVPADLDVLWREAVSTLSAIDGRATPVKLVAADGTCAVAAGADAALELAVLWASGIESMDRMTALGVASEVAAETLVFRTGIGKDLFVELAKIRVLRMGWRKILHAFCINIAPAATVHACVSGRMLARRDPWVNMLRGTGSLWSAIVGGADVVTPAAWDEALGEPDRLARRIARNQAFVLIEEAHLAAPLDAARGSYAIENLCKDLGERAWAILQSIETEGGIVAAIEAGTLQARLRAAADARMKAIATRREPVLGVGEFPNLDEAPVVRRDVRDRKSATSLADIAATSRRMRASAPPPAFGRVAPFSELLDLAARGATVSEIGRALSRRGEGPTVERARPMRDAAAFERLRDRIDRLTRGRGKCPSVTLVLLGSPDEYKVRASYASNAFAAAGFRVTEAVFDGLREQVIGIACVCTSDAVLETDGPSAARALRARGASPLVVAGRVPALESALADAGILHTLFAGCDLVSLLENLVAAEESRP